MGSLEEFIARPGRIYAVLFLAALLEVWGDSYFSSALHRTSGSARWTSVIVGTVILALYGVVVNLSKWDFGTLLGVYVFFFYTAAQLVNLVRFKQWPGLPAVAGWVLIGAGAAVIRIWKV